MVLYKQFAGNLRGKVTMHPQVGTKQVVDLRMSQANGIRRRNDAVGIQPAKPGVRHERFQRQLAQFGDADGGKGPRFRELLQLFQEWIGVAQMTGKAEKFG